MEGFEIGFSLRAVRSHGRIGDMSALNWTLQSGKWGR